MPNFNPSPIEMYFWEALAIMALACLFVPVSRKIGFGSVVGYLASGIAAGLFLSLSFEAHPEKLLHFAEFGIVLFLFVIGLEFRPERLWAMRNAIFARGSVQVAFVATLLTIPPLAFGLSWQIAIVIGLGLALSSTALVMQTLEENSQQRSDHGRTSVSILIFEDLAIVPMLLLVALLAPNTGPGSSLIQNMTTVAWGLAMIAVLVFSGRFLLNPMFAVLARTGVQEIMTAGALGVVIAAALLMDTVGLSYAMGSFIAGVMLASSRFRHEVEADIEPFRGIFLGLFFVAIGLSLDLQIVASNWSLIALAVPLFLTLKIAAVYASGRLFGDDHTHAVKTALTMSQHGEFGFVLFSAAASAALFDPEMASILVSIITLSMAVSSILNRAITLSASKANKPEGQPTQNSDIDVLIIGFGRFGQIVAKPLVAAGLSLSIIDRDADRVGETQAFCSTLQYGDGSRRDILKAAGADGARTAVVAVDGQEQTDEIVKVLDREFPDTLIFVRAYDRRHAIALGSLDGVVRETAAAAFELCQGILEAAGLTQERSSTVLGKAKEEDEKQLAAQISEATLRRESNSHAARVRPKTSANIDD